MNASEVWMLLQVLKANAENGGKYPRIAQAANKRLAEIEESIDSEEKPKPDVRAARATSGEDTPTVRKL